MKKIKYLTLIEPWRKLGYWVSFDKDFDRCAELQFHVYDREPDLNKALGYWEETPLSSTNAVRLDADLADFSRFTWDTSLFGPIR